MYKVFINWLFMLGVDKEFDNLCQYNEHYLTTMILPENYIKAAMSWACLNNKELSKKWSKLDTDWRLFLENYELYH